MKLLQNIFFVLASLLYINCYANELSEPTHKAAEQFVHNTSKQVIDVLTSNKPDDDKSAALTNLFLEVTDVDWMGKFALGKYWASLNDQKKIKYLETYRKYLITAYVPKFKKYNGQRFEIKSIKPLDNDQYLVQTSIKTEGANSQPYSVNYRLKLQEKKFKVRDIIAEDVSLITTQRSEFSSIMSTGGIDSLNNELSNKSLNPTVSALH